MEVALNPLAVPHLLVVIEDDQERISKMKDAVWEQVKDTIELEGFRKGHVPRSLAEKKIGYRKLYKNILKELFAEAIEKCEKKIVGIEGYELDDFMEGHPIIMHAEVYLNPDVLEMKHQDIEITEEPLEVKDDEIEAVIQTAAQSETKTVAVNREAKFGDQVVIDFKTLIGEEAESDREQKDYKVTLGDHVMLEGFEKELVGLKRGSKKSFSVVLPEKYHDIGGQTAKFDVVVKEVFELDRPEIDDKFAKDIGYQSLDDFKAKVGDDLLVNRKQQASSLRDDKIMQALVSRVRFSPIPDCLVIDQVDSTLERQAEALSFSKEELLKRLNVSKDDYRRKHARSALQDIRARLALEAIAEKENIEVSDEERKEYVTAEATKEGQTYEQFISSVSLSMVDTNVKLRKALELLKASVSIKTTEEPAEQKEVVQTA